MCLCKSLIIFIIFIITIRYESLFVYVPMCLLKILWKIIVYIQCSNITISTSCPTHFDRIVNFNENKFSDASLRMTLINNAIEITVWAARNSLNSMSFSFGFEWKYWGTNFYAKSRAGVACPGNQDCGDISIKNRLSLNPVSGSGSAMYPGQKDVPPLL